MTLILGALVNVGREKEKGMEGMRERRKGRQDGQMEQERSVTEKQTHHMAGSSMGWLLCWEVTKLWDRRTKVIWERDGINKLSPKKALILSHFPNNKLKNKTKNPIPTDPPKELKG